MIPSVSNWPVGRLSLYGLDIKTVWVNHEKMTWRCRRNIFYSFSYFAVCLSNSFKRSIVLDGFRRLLWYFGRFFICLIRCEDRIGCRKGRGRGRRSSLCRVAFFGGAWDFEIYCYEIVLLRVSHSNTKYDSHILNITDRQNSSEPKMHYIGSIVLN